MPGYILAIDQGTTGSTVVVLGHDARIVGKATTEFPQHYPKPGWVEHDLGEIWSSVLRSIDTVFRETGIAPTDIAAIGITNQRETTVLWDRRTGEPLHRAIVWQDRRTADRCRALVKAGHEVLFEERAGLLLDPYFSGTKIAFILDEVDRDRTRARGGDVAFGTIDSWLVNKLTGGAVHVTDATNASRTLLYDLRKGTWDEELASILGVPMQVLPEVRGCAEVYGKTKGVPGLPDGIPIAGMAGDQQAALFGQTCFAVGDAKCTYGTGAFLLMNTGTWAVRSKSRMLTTVAWKLGDVTTYALEGSAFIAGAAVQWLRDGLGILKSASEIEAKAREVEDSGGVVFVPALAGLGAPYWDPGARGLLYGITRGTTAAHLCRATLEGIASQIVDLADAMASDAGRPLARLRVDGGAAENDLLMQIQADLLGTVVDRPGSVETTALGAAYLAGLGVGLFDGQGAIVRAHRIDKSFAPGISGEERASRMTEWRSAVRRARSSDMGSA
jgi:glycerol kinase